MTERNDILTAQRDGFEADIDTLVLSGCESEETSGVTFLHSDHLGRPQFATNDNGQVTWDGGITTPFGITMAGLGAQSQALMFPGQYEDAETTGAGVTLSHNWHRTYDPTLGRYLQSDPIGLAGWLNRYAYVGGNPMGIVDPKGLNGIATINSENPNQDSDTGHSWITYTPLDAQGREACGCDGPITIGAWPNGSVFVGQVIRNAKATRKKVPTATRSRNISSSQERALFNSIAEDEKRNGQFFQARKEAPAWAVILGAPVVSNWTLANPCSAWAAKNWNIATGENLSSRNQLYISTPKSLTKEIKRTNRNEP